MFSTRTTSKVLEINLRFERIVEQMKQGTGDHGTVKGRKSDGMGSENEQYVIVCKGDCGYRDGLSIMEIK